MFSYVAFPTAFVHGHLHDTQPTATLGKQLTGAATAQTAAATAGPTQRRRSAAGQRSSTAAQRSIGADSRKHHGAVAQRRGGGLCSNGPAAEWQQQGHSRDGGRRGSKRHEGAAASGTQHAAHGSGAATKLRKRHTWSCPVVLHLQGQKMFTTASIKRSIPHPCPNCRSPCSCCALPASVPELL